ncbi:MAG TPA: DUF6662 family protein [Kofleriaceae bacterium]|nr:DUF6662 family protein [Kofleriaceae bacterium]
MSVRRTFALLSAALAIFSGASVAHANERHFTYTYETGVLPPGVKELEIWTTPRIGKDDYFVRFDQRMEFEVGVTDNLMTSLYLNAKAVTADVAPGVRESTYEFDGVSSEWKYKLSDPVADAIGLGFYGEFTGSTNEVEIEAKILADKQIGNLLFAGNLVFEQEWEFEPEETEAEQVVDLDFAAAYALSPGVRIGVEVRNTNEIAEGEWEHSALFAGPVVSYVADGWWVAATLMPQLPALKKSDEETGSRVLSAHEKLEARLLLSFQI